MGKAGAGAADGERQERKMTAVQVDLGPRSYPIVIGSGLLGTSGSLLREHGLKQRDAFVITDAHVGGKYLEPLGAALAAAGFARVVRHDIPSGEEGKNWNEL